MTSVKSTSTVSRSRLASLGLLATALTATNVVFCANLPEAKQEFPRLGGIQIGRNPFEESYASAEYQAQLARLDMVILGGSGFGSSLNGHAAAIKRINPNVLLGKYFNIAEVSKTATGYFQPQRDVLNTGQGPNNANAFDWWLRNADGEHIEIWSGTYRTNMTEYVKPDSNGDRWTEWRAKYDYNVWFHSDAWDFWFSDLVDWIPRFRSQGIGDYSGGKVSNSSELYAAYRRGHVANWDEIRRLTPDKLITGNINWFLYDKADNRRDLKEYKNQLNGGVLERVMRGPSDDKASEDWQTLYQHYSFSMKYFIDPNVVIFNVIGSPSDFQFFRYAFATCLMNDAFFDFSPEKEYFYGTVEWFDEFDLAGTADTGWLGLSVSAPPTQAWQQGVFRRDFENGIALVNPRGNGKVTVSLENGLRRIAGQQDPTVNNGQTVSVVTLKDGDGIVLVRESAVTRKRPPKSPTLQVD